MSNSFEPRPRRWSRVPRRVSLSDIWMLAGLAFWIGFALLPRAESFPVPCVFLYITGCPCPTCGSGRALFHLTHGELLPALSANAFMTVLLCGLLVYSLYRLLVFWGLGYQVQLKLPQALPRLIPPLTVALLAAQWLVLLRAC